MHEFKRQVEKAFHLENASDPRTRLTHVQKEKFRRAKGQSDANYSWKSDDFMKLRQQYD